MTEHQYKELLAWCRSSYNRGTVDYARKHAIKEQAVALRRQIAGVKAQIKKTMWFLEQAEDEHKKAKFIAWLDDQKEEKRKHMKALADLSL